MRSTGSRRREINLKYREHQDFWEFYIANKEDVDYIIEASCRRFQNILPTEDMKNEILIRLYQTGFLKRFDSGRARLNTYITAMVRGYAKGVAEKESCGKERRVLDSELNGGVVQSLHFSKEEDISAWVDRNYLRDLGKDLEGTRRKVFCLLLEDRSNREISTALNIKKPCTTWYYRTLIKALRKRALYGPGFGVRKKVQSLL